MLLILNFSTLTFITNARTTMPFARLHSQMVCTLSEPAEIPQHMFVQILVQVGGDRKWRTSTTTLRTPTPLVIRDCFLVYCARTWKSASLQTFKCLKRKSQMNSCMGTCVALSIFCLNIALLCSPLNAFETWADQQELSKEARCKSAFSTRRRVSLLELSMLLNNLMEARNQKNCKGSWPHSLSTTQFVWITLFGSHCLDHIVWITCLDRSRWRYRGTIVGICSFLEKGVANQEW